MTQQTPRSAGETDDVVAPRAIDLEAGRRAFIRTLGFGAAGAAVMAAAGTNPAAAQTPTEVDVLNFALNFEYLGAEFYLRATTGRGLPDNQTTGTGTLGPVSGGEKARFSSTVVRGLARELAEDETGHVRVLRGALGRAAIARPAINLGTAFTAAARAAGVVPANGNFNPYSGDFAFLLGAFIFEDVCVTALIGAAGLLRTPSVIATAAGFLAVESYQAGAIRTLLYSRGFTVQANKISNARDSLDGAPALDQGISTNNGSANIVPADELSLAFGRTPQQVLQIAYLNRARRPGGFFPNGVNGDIR